MPANTAPEAVSSRVAADLAAFDEAVDDLRARFAAVPAEPGDKDWVRRKLSHMAELDQFLRGQADTPFRSGYSKEEIQDFWQGLASRWDAIDRGNARDLKALLERYGWFRLSEFGPAEDDSAWLLVQHADHDAAFQKAVLETLASLYPAGETSAAHYAYLYDRVATNEGRPQKYGTQGRCVGPGRWEPGPLEDPGRVDELRGSMGLEPLEDYKKRFAGICR